MSLGAEKNFREFMLRLADRRIDPDVQWFQRLAAMAILFRSAEKIVQQQRFGGYRAQIVTYTVAKLSYATQHRINLDGIWRQQRLSPALEQAIVELSHHVFQILTNPSGTVRHIGEWCKKLDCWKAVEELDWQPSDSLRRELKVVARPGKAQPTNQGLAGATRHEEALITQIADVPAETWFEISRWAAQTGNLQPWQRRIAYSVGELLARGQRPSIKQAQQSKLLYDEARRLGLQLDVPLES